MKINHHKRTVMHIALFCTTLAPFAYESAQAQTAPDAGALQRQQEQSREEVPQQLPEPQMLEDETTEGQVAPTEPSGPTILIRKITFTGDSSLLDKSELNGIVSPAIGQALGVQGLQALADEVTKVLQQRGYMLARAYLPEQNVSSGTITIAVMTGRLDGDPEMGGGWKIEVTPQARIQANRLIKIGEDASPSGSAAQKKDLERALLLMNDLPSIAARSRLEPGSTPGTTRIVVRVEESSPLSAGVWADNYGNYSTGRTETGSQLSINDPFGHGERFYAITSFSEGIRNWHVGIEHPIGAHGLRVSTGYNHMTYEVVEGTGKIAGLKGKSRTGYANANYPLVRARAANLYANLRYEYKALRDDSSAGVLRDKRIQVAAIGLRSDLLDKIGGGGLTNAGFTITAGELDLSRALADKAVDAATLGTHGDFLKVNGDLSRLQKLPNHFTLFARASGQWAEGNLDSSEEFILGGISGVRSYPTSEGQGDKGWISSVEVRYDIPRKFPVGRLRIAAFTETGAIWQNEDPGLVPAATATGKNRYRLGGSGVSATLTQNNRYQIRASWAHVAGDNPGRDIFGNDVDGHSHSDRLWLQIQSSF